MAGIIFLNIEQKNDIKKEIIIYRLVNILVYIIIIKDKIGSFLKNRILLKEKKNSYLFFSEKFQKNYFLLFLNSF